ncbi:MAG: recombinase family protein [Mycobacteriales bacterium]
MTRAPLRAIPDTAERALGLVRVSKERVGMISPELQTTAITDYVAARGYDLVGWLEGLDESGSQRRSRWWRRLDEAIGQVEAGEVNVIVVWKFSRAARHRLLWAVAVDRVDVAGGRLESATEQVDTATSTGRLTRGMLAELNAWEAEVKGEQWKEVHARRTRLGPPHRPTPRIGYQLIEGYYQPDPQTGQILAEAYRRYVAGDGLLRVTRWLNAAGLRTTTGRPFTSQAVATLLDSGFAAGLLHRDSGEHLPGAHEALIDEKTWQAYLTRRAAQRQVPARVKEPRYVLTGLVRCGRCGGPAVAQTSRYGPGHMYCCSTWHTNRRCPGVWAVRPRVEQAVLDWLAAFAADLEQRTTARVAAAARRSTARADVGRLAREIIRLDERLVRLTAGYTDGLIPAHAYAAHRDELLATRTEAERAVEQARAVSALTSPEPATVRGLLGDWQTLPVAARRDALASMISRVVLIPTDRGRTQVQVIPTWD